MAKMNLKRVPTPIGTFIYPHLLEPDTKFDELGVYSTRFAVDADDADGLLTTIAEVLEAFITNDPKGIGPAKLAAADKAAAFEAEADDEGNPTGRLIFKFKLKAVASGNGKQWKQAPVVVDAALNKLDPTTKIGTGSQGRVEVELFPYYMASTKSLGVSLRVRAAQITKLVEYGNGSTTAFGVVEGGFAADQAPASTFEAESETSAEASECDEF